jgi:DinB superfamily
MRFRIEEAVEVLSRTPATLKALLAGISPAWRDGTEGPETFSPFDNVGHLIHGEKADWMPRLRIILEHGPSRPFEKFDRFAQNDASRGKTLDELLDTFASLRAANLAALRAIPLDDAALARKGTHPELGEVRLEQLLATWVAHDLGHVAQIARVMAKQYKAEVGPWVAYLPVLTR